MPPDPDAALAALLGRHSLGARHLAEPAPDDAQLALMVQAALRAPDHGGLVPFRFAAIRGGAARLAFAALFERAAVAAGKPAQDALRDRERALAAPLTLAVVARIDAGHPLAPAHEQWIALGGALSNLLTAAHLLGFGGKMLSGAKVRAPELVAAFCGPGETLVGWIDLGTPRRAVTPKGGKPDAATVLRPWQPPADAPSRAP